MKHIILATDNNFVQHCAVTMTSILEHNNEICFYILTEGLSAKNEKVLNDLVNKYHSKLNILSIDSSIVEKFPMPQTAGFSHISVATYYRLFIASLLPQDVNKVLYLDCDIVVRDSLDELFNIDIEGYSLGAVFQDDPLLLQGDEYERLGLQGETGYFNAGVLLINLKYWRDNDVEKRLLNYISNNTENIRFHDQDTLNAVLAPSALTLDCKWNTLTIFLTRAIYRFTSPRCINYRNQILSGVGKNPTIVHFVSRPKPWDWSCSHPFKKDYFTNLDKTVYHGWRPKWKRTFREVVERVKNITIIRGLGLFSDLGIFVRF